ncbi:NUDIX domain-containing protein [Peribacillus frigoritolerans]|uniref:NUDIX domain-containing protein n=1 Tax=Peribacillus frigoritolerans TaxID=450367 RepID=UPI0039A3D779
MGGNKILLTKNQDDEGYFYLFPGGGQEHGETIHNALLRECMEEVGEEVEIGELLHIREYIGKNQEHSSFDFHVHQVEYYFVSNLVKGKNN